MADRLIRTYPLTSNISTLPLSELRPGIYQCSIVADGRDIVTKKLVVIR